MTVLRQLGVAALLLSGAVFVSRLVGYLREAYIAARFGAAGATDAFYDAFTFPDWLNYLLAGGTLSITLLPIYGGHLSKGDDAAANRAFSTVATFVVLLVGAGVSLGVVFARPLVTLYFHRLDPAAQEACVRFTRILFPAQLFHIVGGMLVATLLARKRFLAVAVAPIVYTSGIIAGGVLLGDRLGQEALCWGALVGAVAGPFLLVAVSAVRAGVRYRPNLSLRSGDFVHWILLSLPLMIGVSLVTADDFILRYFASESEGAVTHLNNGKRLALVAIAVAGQAVGQASMPFFTQLFAEGRREELAATFAQTLRSAATFAVLASALVVALAEPIVMLLFGRGAYGAEDVARTAVYLSLFAAAIPFWTLQGLTARLFYAAHNTLLPMVAGTIVTALAVPVYLLLFEVAGLPGLAMASGVGIGLHTLALFGLAPRLLPELRGRLGPVFSGLARALVLAAIAGAAAFGARHALAPRLAGDHLASAILIGAGSLVFATLVVVLARPLRIPEPALLLRRLRRK